MGAKCHSCVSRNPGYFVPATGLLCYKRIPGNLDYSYLLDSRLRGNDPLGLARQERGELLHPAKVFPFF
jgi:hypothetical protein